eukprot:TRINITY_DN61665_c0_g1_i1.p1 TRINITY_DN61665_c0_g1~~TRINITY_DN61665_c0_g1_i1.p1  ORF type:complete len:891 (+),score=172.99 TRINITY_DN61665_c0_g1_i1:138-2810(+)
MVSSWSNRKTVWYASEILCLFCLIFGFYGVFYDLVPNRCEKLWPSLRLQPIPLPSWEARHPNGYHLFHTASILAEPYLPHPPKEDNSERIPVLFIHGNRGYVAQVKEIGAHVEKEMPGVFDFFSIDFVEEASGFNGRIVERQAEFVNECLQKISSSGIEGRKDRKKVIVIAHSMGGIALRMAMTLPSYPRECVLDIVAFSTPQLRLPAFVDFSLDRIFSRLNRISHIGGEESHASTLETNNGWENVVMSTISGGERDTLIGAHLTQISGRIAELHVVESETAFMDDVHIENDHLCIVWCEQTLHALTRYLQKIAPIYQTSGRPGVQNASLASRFNAASSSFGEKTFPRLVEQRETPDNQKVEFESGHISALNDGVKCSSSIFIIATGHPDPGECIRVVMKREKSHENEFDVMGWTNLPWRITDDEFVIQHQDPKVPTSCVYIPSETCKLGSVLIQRLKTSEACERVKLHTVEVDPKSQSGSASSKGIQRWNGANSVNRFRPFRVLLTPKTEKAQEMELFRPIMFLHLSNGRTRMNVLDESVDVFSYTSSSDVPSVTVIHDPLVQYEIQVHSSAYLHLKQIVRFCSTDLFSGIIFWIFWKVFVVMFDTPVSFVKADKTLIGVSIYVLGFCLRESILPEMMSFANQFFLCCVSATFSFDFLQCCRGFDMRLSEKGDMPISQSIVAGILFAFASRLCQRCLFGFVSKSIELFTSPPGYYVRNVVSFCSNRLMLVAMSFKLLSLFIHEALTMLIAFVLCVILAGAYLRPLHCKSHRVRRRMCSAVLSVMLLLFVVFAFSFVAWIENMMHDRSLMAAMWFARPSIMSWPVLIVWMWILLLRRDIWPMTSCAAPALCIILSLCVESFRISLMLHSIMGVFVLSTITHIFPWRHKLD